MINLLRGPSSCLCLCSRILVAVQNVGLISESAPANTLPNQCLIQSLLGASPVSSACWAP